MVTYGGLAFYRLAYSFLSLACSATAPALLVAIFMWDEVLGSGYMTFHGLLRRVTNQMVYSDLKKKLSTIYELCML